MYTGDIITTLKNSQLSVNLGELSVLKDSVKNSFNNIENCSHILDSYPFLKHDINERIETNSLPQPGRIVETLIVQSIANLLNCEYEGNGYYVNEDISILQDGGSGQPDLVIFDKKNNTETVFEIKEPFAYGKTCGFVYDDNGKPIQFTSRSEEVKYYFKSFFLEGGVLEKYNILDNEGHNSYFPLSDTITGCFDYIVSFDKLTGKLIFMTVYEYKELFDFKIEVRPCGRNTRNVFTPSKLNLTNEVLFFKPTDVTEITSRGGINSSRYKYISKSATFSFRKTHVIKQNDVWSIPLKKIKQHVGEVSIQHCIK
jgi:hypothetical protein